MERMDYTIHNGDCLEVMATMDANSVDAIVSDPPYGLSFMGKGWDHAVPGVEFWAEALRVAKPGAHLLAFGGTRLYHRLTCAIEDAGWEVRDCLMWLYGSGFPKSHDVSKAIDKVNGEAGRLHRFTAWMRTTGVTAAQVNAATETFMGSHYLTSGSQPAIPTPHLWAKLRPICGDVPEWVDRLVDRIAAEREVVGTHRRLPGNPSVPIAGCVSNKNDGWFDITAPATDAAKRWQGWGTALKPAWEPIILARKPLAGTVAANVTEWDTGGINVDGCRVGTDGGTRKSGPPSYKAGTSLQGSLDGSLNGGGCEPTGQGRWPANLLLEDGTIDAEWTRYFYQPKASKADRDEGLEDVDAKPVHRYGAGIGEGNDPHAPAMNRNVHPTVKPTDLMRYLCRLVTPPGAKILDPFMGSGSTGKAATLEGFQFIGIDLDPNYCDIARRRIEHARTEAGLYASTA